MFLLPEIRRSRPGYIVFVFVFTAESLPVVLANDPLANESPHFVVNKANVIFSFLTSAAALGTSWTRIHLILLNVMLHHATQIKFTGHIGVHRGCLLYFSFYSSPSSTPSKYLVPSLSNKFTSTSWCFVLVILSECDVNP